MRSPRDGSPGAASRTRRRVQASLFSAAIAFLVLGTVAGVFLAHDRAAENADERARASADASAAALETLVLDTAVALRGVGVVADRTGIPDVSTFQAFADDLQASGVRLDLALVRAPTDDLRQLESLAVSSMRDGPVARPAATLVTPEVGRALRHAQITRGPAVSDLTPLLLSSGRGVVVIRPVVARQVPGSPVVAFVVADLPSRMLAQVLDESSGDLRVSLLSDDATVLGADVDPRSRRAGLMAGVDLPGVRWTVIVLGAPSAGVLQPLLVAAAGAIATITMLVLLVVTSRHQRTLRTANERLAQGQQRTRAVQELAGRLAHALTGDEVVHALVQHLPTAVGARSASLATVGPQGELRVVGRRETEGNGSLAAPDPGSLLGETLQTNEPRWLASPLMWRDDAAVEALVGAGRAAAILPLEAGGERGVIIVAYENVHIFADDERALLETVGLLASRALARGQRYDDEHRVAVAFQAAALPDALPDVDGLTVAARYRPATRAASVGGDWYDVVVLDDQEVVLVVGDVVGHGLAAAATMGRLRTAFQVIAPLSHDPADMLRAMSVQVDSIPDAFCTTIVCAVIDLGAGEIRWSRAGHLPPVLVRSGGCARLLDDPGVTPLGVVPDAAPPVHHLALTKGDVVVLYTDGVIERRTESIEVGLERIQVVAGDLADLAPVDFADALVEALVPTGEQTDDIAVLVARYDGPAVDL